MPEIEPEVIWHHCNECLRENQHTILFERKKRVSHFEGNNEIAWITTTSILECCGCESLSLKKSVYCTEDEHTEVTVFPPSVSRQKPNWHAALPDEYQALLTEIYSALHSDSRMLALMGARALVDMFMTRHIGNKGGFEAKLNQLTKLGFLGARDSEMLSAAIDAGSAAAHRGHCPSQENALSVVDIVENLLHKEVLSQTAETLRRDTPSRNAPSDA